jgi:hypothetical protein
MVYLWRAVDAEGEVLDVLVQSKRNKHAALKLMRKLLKKQHAFVPERMITDGALMAPPRESSGSKIATSAVDGKTTAPRTRISQLGEDSARCKASRVPDRRRDFFPLMRRPTTPSTSSAISRQGRHTERSEPRR